MIKIEKATSHKDYQQIVDLANIIIPEVYYPIVPEEHVNTFMKKYQSIEAIEEQINQDFQYYFLKYSEEIVGYLGIVINNAILLISKLYILKEYRGRRIGKWAIDFIEKEAMKANCTSIDLLVNEFNSHSIDFYKLNGYITIDLIEHNFNDGHIVRDFKMQKLCKPVGEYI
ncbi:MAG TPA: GNAT family N-acetyltransferase [Saprospiraceae bacterium]|nr:GNAT family N-acetyltransferase [Saprospiraceae bacterium]